MGNLADIGDIAGLVGSIVGLAIAAIVLLTFAPLIAGDINSISLQGVATCKLVQRRVGGPCGERCGDG